MVRDQGKRYTEDHVQTGHPGGLLRRARAEGNFERSRARWAALHCPVLTSSWHYSPATKERGSSKEGEERIGVQYGD